jgi:DNA-binding NarL/FixJ family response regulator
MRSASPFSWLNAPAMTPVDARVIVVEDNAFTRTTLVGALRNEGVNVVGDAGTAAEALEVARVASPHAAMIDLDLGGGPSGADLAAELRELLPSIGIVILTSYEDPRLTGRNLDHLPTNARYVIKGDLGDARMLVDALRNAITAARSGCEVVADERVVGDAARLTDAQVEVMRMVAEGLSNVEIARRRYISETSVERMIMRIARELGIPTESASNRRVLLTRAYLRMTGAVSVDD